MTCPCSGTITETERTLRTARGVLRWFPELTVITTAGTDDRAAQRRLRPSGAVSG
jgi:hypothetical protein